MDYVVVGQSISYDKDGNQVLGEVRDYGLTPEEIEEEILIDDLKRR